VSAGGYRIRAARRDDLDAVLALQIACDVDEHGESDETREEIAAQWAQHGFDLGTDTWVAADCHEEIVAHAWVEERRRGRDVEADVLVHPAWRTSDVARELLVCAGRRAPQQVASAPPGAHPSLSVFCAAVNDWKRALLVDDGFAPARVYLRMRIDLEGPFAPAPSPEGVALRVFDPATEARALHAALDEAFSDEFLTRSEAREDWEQRLIRRPDFDPTLWLVAWDGREIAGAVVAYETDKSGWVRGLGVRARWRGRGLALALLTRAFLTFFERGRRRAGLAVDSENETGATRLYERSGMRVDQRWTLYRRPLTPH
jgi:mycothiol synthase